MAPIMKIFLTLFIATILLTSNAVQAEERLYRIGMPCIEASGCYSPEIEAFFGELYSRMGLESKIVYLPRRRDLKYSNEGKTDASAGRVKAHLSDYPNLIPVEIPIAVEPLAAFTVKPGIKIESWADLRNLKVGIVLGSMPVGLLCKQNDINPCVTNEISKVFRLLHELKIDAVVHNLHIGRTVAKAHKIPFKTSPVLHKSYMYHLLNRKHAHLAPDLAKIIKEMHEDGTSARLLGKWSILLPEIASKVEESSSIKQ